MPLGPNTLCTEKPGLVGSHSSSLGVGWASEETRSGVPCPLPPPTPWQLKQQGSSYPLSAAVATAEAMRTRLLSCADS